jgi:hypothetical protein
MDIYIQIWFYEEGDYYTAVWENDYTNIPEFQRIFVALELNLLIKRAGQGILVCYVVMNAELLLGCVLCSLWSVLYYVI